MIEKVSDTTNTTKTTEDTTKDTTETTKRTTNLFCIVGGPRCFSASSVIDENFRLKPKFDYELFRCPNCYKKVIYNSERFRFTHSDPDKSNCEYGLYYVYYKRSQFEFDDEDENDDSEDEDSEDCSTTEPEETKTIESEDNVEDSDSENDYSQFRYFCEQRYGLILGVWFVCSVIWFACIMLK